MFPSLVSQDPPPALLQPLTNALIILHYMTIALRGHIERSNLKKCPKSLPIITATARVPHSRPKTSESTHHHRDLKSPTHHPPQSRGCAVVSLTHVYKPLVGLYSCGRATEKRPNYLEHHVIVFRIVKPL